MRYNKLILSLAACALMISGCSDSTSNSETSSFPENSDLKIIRTADPDAVFYDIDELIQEADVIMIGEYLEEGRSTNGMTFNTLKAIKVFKGEDKLESGTLPIYECYAYSTDPEGNKQLRLDTCYVPMHKGDKAIFVLGYNEYQKSYGPFEYEGRFPLPEDLGKKDDLGFTNGVLKEEQFNKEIYDQLLERFNISEEDNYSRGDKMKKQILVLTAAMLMTGCTESSESTENNAAFSYGDVTSAQSCDSEKRYEHFKIIDGAVETVETNTICKMRIVFDTVDYLSGVDKIGNELLGEKYNKAKWNIYEHRPDPDSDFTIRDGQYSDNRFGGLFTASDNAIFVYAPKMFDTTAPGSFGDKITDIREGFFKDKNTTLESVKAQAEKLIWLFDDSIGAEHSTISGIYYHTDKDVIEFDFKQTINEIEISSVPYTLGSYSYDIYSEELKRSQGLGRKSVFVNSNEDYYIDINSPHIAAEPTEKYDEIITLDSALEYLDNNLAVNLNYDMVGAELKYLAVTESTDSEKNTVALPVWEFQLINHTEKQRYVCQINAVSGESSFVKVKGAVE